MIINGKVHLFSLIRHVRDPQQLLNIYKSAIAEKIGLGNRVPYVGYKGQFKDSRWENANKLNYAYLEAELITLPNGSVAPLPQRQQMEEQIQALSVAAVQEVEDLKSGMGIFDALVPWQLEREAAGPRTTRRRARGARLLETAAATETVPEPVNGSPRSIPRRCRARSIPSRAAMAQATWRPSHGS